jgi:DNA-binding IscR family transcriptional regulator
LLRADRGAFAITPACILRRALHEARSAFLKVLDGYTLADLVKNRAVLSALLVGEPLRAGAPRAHALGPAGGPIREP